MFIRFIECCIHNFVESSLARLICLRSHYHCQFWCLIKIGMTAFYFAFPAALLNHLSADWFILEVQPNDNFLSHVHHFSLKAWLHWERQLIGIIPVFVCLLSPHLPLSCFTPTFPFHSSRVAQNNPIFSIFLNFHFSFPALLLMTPNPMCSLYRTHGWTPF